MIHNESVRVLPISNRKIHKGLLLKKIIFSLAKSLLQNYQII